MAKPPAARILLKTTEVIRSAVEKPSVTFKRKGNKSIVTITLAFNDIANTIEDSDIDDDPLVFCDARYDKANFLDSGNAKVYFMPLGVNGASTMYVEADIDTKLPGTGSSLYEILAEKAARERSARQKADTEKPAKQTKGRKAVK